MKKTAPVAIDPLPEQQRFIFTRAKFAAYVGGLGSGKTWAGCLRAMLRAIRGETGLILAPTYTMLRDVTQQTLIELLTLGSWPYDHRKAEEKKAQEFAKNSDAIPNYTRTAFFNERRKIDDARLLQRFLAFMKRNQADWSRMRKIMGDWLHSSQLADPDGKRVAYTESADPIMCAGFPRVLLPFDYTWSPIDRVYDSSYPALFNNKLMTWLEIFTHPGGKAWLRLRHLKWLKNWRNLTGGMAKVCYLASIAKFALAERFNLATLTNVDNRYTLFGVAAWWATALDKRQEFDDALRKNMVSADNITTGEACQLAVEMWQVYSSMEQRHGLMQ